MTVWRALGGLWLILSLGAWPAEAAFELSTDQRPVAFGVMQVGEEKTLAQFGTYHNQITCSSTNGQTWYLKVNLIAPFSAGAETIPLERFTWEITSTTGHGTLAHPHEPTPFRLTPDLVYLSGADEAAGQSVSFQFRYSLTIPEAQVSGIYQTTIRFTLTEIL